jgi:hypothetical protein
MRTRADHRRRGKWLPRGLPLAVVLLVLASCSTTRLTNAHPEGTPTVTATPMATLPTAAASPSAASRLAPPRVAGLSWRPAGSVVNGVPATYVAQTDGGAIGLLWIDPTAVSFRLIPGKKVPEGSPVLPADNVPSTWIPRMVAAFNGGFLLTDGVGGYYYARRLVRPLVSGLAAFEITSNGRLSVGAWGRDLRLTPQTVAVRQNLPLLVDNHQSRIAPTDKPRTWGEANGGLWTANRSALGQLDDGSLVFAYGHELRPAAMAQAMLQVGARAAMVLDMNKSWPGGFVYSHLAGHIAGQRIQRLEYHSPSVYYARFTKDFVAVLRR